MEVDVIQLKKICGYTANFLGIKSDPLKIETHFLKANLEKAIANVKHILEKKSLATFEKLQLLVDFLFFTAKLVIMSRTCLRCFYDVLSQIGKFLH